VELEAILDHELCALRHGIFNLGFLAVNKTDEGRRFLEWWRDRCTAFCWGDWREGVFTDQKWVNFAPVFFPSTRILYSPRLNVAPWNINDRDLRGTFDEGFHVGDEPLGFFHFSGFDSGDHRTMIDKWAGEKRAAHMLADWYEARTRDSESDEACSWSLDRYDNGERIRDLHRRIYRERIDLKKVFPDPFRVREGEASLYGWMSEHGPLEYPELLSSEAE
jgi:hypothetical protein